MSNKNNFNRYFNLPLANRMDQLYNELFSLAHKPDIFVARKRMTPLLEEDLLDFGVVFFRITTTKITVAGLRLGYLSARVTIGPYMIAGCLFTKMSADYWYVFVSKDIDRIRMGDDVVLFDSPLTME